MLNDPTTEILQYFDTCAGSSRGYNATKLAAVPATLGFAKLLGYVAAFFMRGT